VMKSCDRFIISEPIKNLSSGGGVISWIAKRMADAGNGNEVFRFNVDTLKSKINNISGDKIDVIDHGIYKKDIILELKWK